MLPEVSKKGYVSVVQSLVAFSKVNHDDGGSKKQVEKQKASWFSTINNRQPPPNSQDQILGDVQKQDKVPKYTDKFDPRVTAR